MARKPPFRAVAKIDPAALATFQAGIRKRYTNEQILSELRASAGRLGRSPTMREFAADSKTTVHPQTVIEHFGSWNAAKREAGLVPRRFATREELVGLLHELGRELGRTPTAKDLDARRGSMPSKSLYWHTFGSLSAALREAEGPAVDDAVGPRVAACLELVHQVPHGLAAVELQHERDVLEQQPPRTATLPPV
jgi:hypothetical protein